METNRLLDLFCELARIESPSRREAAMAARCARELRDLGFKVRFDASAAQTGSDTGNLIAHLPGTAPRSLVLSAHMDTVQPCAGIEPAVVDGVVRSVGDTILSADDKALALYREKAAGQLARMMAARNKALAEYMQSTHGATAPAFRVQTMDSLALPNYTGRDRYTIALEVDGETVEVEAEDDNAGAGAGTDAGAEAETDAGTNTESNTETNAETHAGTDTE